MLTAQSYPDGLGARYLWLSGYQINYENAKTKRKSLEKSLSLSNSTTDNSFFNT